jgi:putative endonuclease
MARAHELGRTGEALAAGALAASGWTILHRNYRLRHKEIDIVARRGRLVAFVEVKTRAGTAWGHPLEAITAAQRREITRVAHAWIARHGRPDDHYRFDAVAVLWAPGEPVRIEHVPDAWRL